MATTTRQAANLHRQTPTANLSWGREIRDTLKLALPLIVAQLAQMALFTTDAVMMGWLGPKYLGAGTLMLSFFHPFFLFGVGVIYAVAPLVAQARGAGDAVSVRRSVRQGLWMAMFLAVLLTPVIWNVGSIFEWMGQPEEVSLLSGSYARAAVWVFFPGLAFIVLRILLAAHNDTSIILVITVIGIAVNAVCNYALMFGNWGFPRLELAGAGISTVLVNTLMFLLALLYAVTRPQIRPYQLFLRFWKPDWPRFAKILRLGMPIGLLMTAEVGLFAVGAIFMGWLGANELAGHAVAMQYAGIAFMVPMGLSQASTVRVGIAHGRRDAEGVRKAGWVSIALGTGFMALTGTIFWLAPEPLVGLFLDPALPQNQVPFALAVAYLGVAALFQLADGAQVVSAAVLRGLSDTTVPMIVGVFGYSGIGLSTAYLCGFVYDLRGVGIWYGLAGGLIVVALILCSRFALRDRLGLMR